jgi:molybdate transport system regulatory protein
MKGQRPSTHGDGVGDDQEPAAKASTTPSGHIEPAQRIWFHDDGKPMFGPGTLKVLVLVTQTGSLHQAAKKMGMAYSKAWRIVKDAEDHLGYKLLDRQIGGAGGGGATLTPDGQRFVARYAAMRAEAEADLQRLFLKYFGDEPFASPAPGTR